ncbi:hypothetical protein ACIOKD_04590 [Streptomyces sp. NPDC087844]|uniref:hypothetical protein n=1 Tax=Streptomyces sp. NPDC087844 TaxID=3365805 RepID=UPI003811C475
MRKVMAGLAVLGLALTGCGTDDGGGGDRGNRGERGDGRATSAGMSWAYDEILDEGSLSDVLANGADDVWAVGTVPSGNEPLSGEGFLLHRDGTRWQRQPIPAVLGDSVHQARLDGLGSGEFLLTASVQDTTTSRTAHWDGAKWTVLPRTPGGGRVTEVKAFAADDVWALTTESRFQHWDGARWSAVTLPDGVTATSLDGVASDDLWAAGYRGTGDGTDGHEMQQPAAVHWDGKAWRLTDTPEYRYPDPVPAEPSASIARVLAFAADDVRAYGTHSFNHGEGENEPQEEAVRLRWDGARWSEVADAQGDCAERVPVARDGVGGVFLDGSRYVTGDGACTKIKRSRLPSEGGVRDGSRQSLWLSAVESVPGTDQVLGVGQVQVNQSGDPMNKAVIVSLKR